MAQTAHTPGPYWVRTNTNGSHDVCGRNAKIIRSYPAHMVAAADQDCRRLQKAYSASEKALRDAAPELLEACKRLASTIESAGEADDYRFLFDAISKAEGR